LKALNIDREKHGNLLLKKSNPRNNESKDYQGPE